MALCDADLRDVLSLLRPFMHDPDFFVNLDGECTPLLLMSLVFIFTKCYQASACILPNIQVVEALSQLCTSPPSSDLVSCHIRDDRPLHGRTIVARQLRKRCRLDPDLSRLSTSLLRHCPPRSRLSYFVETTRDSILYRPVSHPSQRRRTDRLRYQITPRSYP